MCRSTKTLKSLIEDPYVVDVKVHVLSFKMIFISSQQRVPTPSYPFRGDLGDQVKGHSPTKLKSLREVPSVADLNIPVPSCTMIHISAPWRVPTSSCPIWEKIGRTSKASFTEKTKIVDSSSICSAPDSTGSKLQYEPHLFSLVCSQTELSISGKFWEIR